MELPSRLGYSYDHEDVPRNEEKNGFEFQVQLSPPSSGASSCMPLSLVVFVSFFPSSGSSSSYLSSHSPRIMNSGYKGDFT